MRKENYTPTRSFQKILLYLVVFALCSCYSLGQTVFSDYEDGKIWIKLKESVALTAPEPAQQEKFTPDHFSFTRKLKAKYRLQELGKPFVKFKKIPKGSALERTYLLTFKDIRNVEPLIKELMASGMLEYAEKVPINKPSLSPNDPGVPTQWNLAKINAPVAWNYFSAGSNVVIAIVDDAVQRTHPDLAPNLWVNPGEIPWNRRDDDGNGYIDDVNGWDVGSNDDNPNPDGPSWEHGTHVAGIASAVTNNGIGVASIGFSSKLMCVKVTTWYDSESFVSAYEGILYAAQNGADIINLSWGGGGYSTTNQNIITAAVGMGSIIVAAAGNQSTNFPFYPAAYNGVFSVAATNSNDGKAWFSNYGSWVKISAPGEAIYSTAINSSYATFSGTSMASPLVAGLAALIRAVNPGLSAQGVINCITSTATNINGLNPSYSGLLGAGRINAAAAMQCAAPPCGPPSGLNATNITDSTAILKWSAVPGAGRYDLEWKLATEPATSWRRVEVDATSYILTDLASATTYTFRVRSKCNPDFSAYSTPFTFTSTGILCNVPTGLVATNITNNSAFLSWNNMPDSKGYVLQYKTADATVWRYPPSNHIIIGLPFPENFLQLNFLMPNTNYHFRVKTICNSGNSLYSTPGSFTTSSCSGAPTGLTARNVTNTTGVLSWQPVPGASSYTLQWLSWFEGVWRTVPDITTNSYTVSDLRLGTWHTFQVTTICSNGSSAASESFLFKSAGSFATGITVAGGNGAGTSANQLHYPGGMCVDENGNIYVADSDNHRVMKWAPGATEGIVVAGGNGGGPGAHQLNAPKGIFRDADGNLYIADAGNHRVQKWMPGATTGITVAGGNGSGPAAHMLNHPHGVFVDATGNVYVSDTENDRVQKWTPGAATGITVAGVGIAGSAANMLNYPLGIFVDPNGDLFIADSRNHRIQKWAAGATTGVTVAGGNGSGPATEQLDLPHEVFVFWGKIYIADARNNRVQRWSNGDYWGETMAGGNGAGQAPNQFNNPQGIFIDKTGILYVADTDNHRVQKFGPVYHYTKAKIDTIVVPLQQKVSSREQVTENTATLTIAPNPVKGTNAAFSYRLAADGKVMMKIIDLHGRLLQTADLGHRKAGAYLHSMDMNKQVNGYYIVVLEQNNRTVARKQFIISR